MKTAFKEVRFQEAQFFLIIYVINFIATTIYFKPNKLLLIIIKCIYI